MRKILGETVQFTSDKEDYKNVNELPENADFFRYQAIVNPSPRSVPSHCVIDSFIKQNGTDYRYEVAPDPVAELRDRKKDNTCVGRKPNAADSKGFFCNKA